MYFNFLKCKALENLKISDSEENFEKVVGFQPNGSIPKL